MLLELLRQQARHLAGERHQQYAGSRAIETVHGKDVLPELIAHRLHHKASFMTVQPTAVHQPARRLVHRHQVFILIQNLYHIAFPGK